MKHVALTIGLIAFGTGAIRSKPDLQPLWATAAQAGDAGEYIDTDLFWRESSGPHGERNSVALPLYQATFSHDYARVKSLLDHGVSPNALLYPGGWSALMVAVVYNDQKTVQLLVKYGADLNYVSNDPATGTPLAAALSYGRFYTIENHDFVIFHDLLNAGADMNVEFHGDDIATYAVVVGQIAVINELLARGYRHNLPRLKRWLEIVHVDAKNQPEKDKALAKIEQLSTQ